MHRDGKGVGEGRGHLGWRRGIQKVAGGSEIRRNSGLVRRDTVALGEMYVGWERGGVREGRAVPGGNSADCSCGRVVGSSDPQGMQAPSHPLSCRLLAPGRVPLVLPRLC